MSLDVYLEGETRKEKCECRECRNVHEKDEAEELFTANITHNLGRMADAAGIYQALWRPEEIGATKAKDIAPILRAGLEKMKANPDEFRKHEPSNRWGTYDRFVPWIEDYLRACEEYPEATVKVSR